MDWHDVLIQRNSQKDARQIRLALTGARQKMADKTRLQKFAHSCGLGRLGTGKLGKIESQTDANGRVL